MKIGKRCFKNEKKIFKKKEKKLLLNLSEEIELQKSDKYVALSNLSIYFIWKSIK